MENAEQEVKTAMGKRLKKNTLLACLLAAVCLAGGCGKQGSGQAGESTGHTAQGPEKPQGEGDTKTVDPEDEAKKLQREEYPSFRREQIRGMSVAENGTIRYQLQYLPRSDRDSFLYWDMPVPYASSAVVDTEAMYGLFDAVSALDFGKKQAGSGAKRTAREDAEWTENGTYITVNYCGEQADSTKQADADRTVTVIIGEKKDGRYECRLLGWKERTLYLKEAAVARILHQDPYAMLLKIPYVINVATVKKVEIQCGPQTHTMEREEDAYWIDGKKADRDKYLDLYAELMQPMLDGEIPKDAAAQEKKEPLLTIRYVRSLEGAQDQTVAIYPYGDGRYTVDVNGHQYFFLVPQDVQTLYQSFCGPSI